MLVLSRKVGEKIYVGDDIVITLTDARHGKVRIGIDAPDGVPIVRAELVDQWHDHGVHRVEISAAPGCSTRK